eukprot:Hpha_TRINITY_DN9163_c0_g1::TRINITY_DN9163_c0_g1_i1::g.94302::m.94302/K15296/NAPA, SNAPA, SEC17; alpha-soluble NSF attachment protein
MTGRGPEFMDQAEKRLKKWSLFGGGSKYEDAAELFEKAGNQFKISKDWKNAGTAFMKASDCHHHSKEPYQCAVKLTEAASCFRKAEGDCSSDTVKCWDAAVDTFADEGKFTNAGKVLKELGAFHRERGENDKAIAAFKKAADFFSGEEQHVSANGALMELGKLYMEETQQWKEAWEVFETIARSYVAHSSMKFQVKDVLLRAMLCRFGRVTAANREEQAADCRDALGRYLDLDVHLQGTRECELMENVINAIENDDPDAVSKASIQYSGVKPLDDTQVFILQTLREALQDDTGALC